MKTTKGTLRPSATALCTLTLCLVTAARPFLAKQNSKQCKQQCVKQNRWEDTQIKLKEAGDTAIAEPECACLKPDTEVTWTNDDKKPWTVDFDSLQANPFTGARHLHFNSDADKDDRRRIKHGGKIKVYHYKAKINGRPIDPHVVVGPAH